MAMGEYTYILNKSEGRLGFQVLATPPRSTVTADPQPGELTSLKESRETAGSNG